jgi:hypothetical protein
MTIMAASLGTQTSMETGGHGLFTAALLDALDGGAADILGEISTSAVYALVERRFNLWQQRPVAKSYITKPTILRRVAGRLSWADLHRIREFFPDPEHKYPLTPDHDPERDVNEVARIPIVEDKVKIGRMFKQYRDAGLVCASLPGEDFYYVAQRSHTVELTLFGREYWRLA